MKDQETIAAPRSVRFPADLARYIERVGKENERNFSRQVVYMLRKAMATKSLALPGAKK
jgi:hypothetical protein